MTIAKELKLLDDIVEKLLRESPIYRDSDKKLVSRVWADQIGGKENAKKMSFYEFLVRFVTTDTIFLSDSITRARRRVQENHEDLRGVNWQKRHDETHEVKKALGYKQSLF